MSPSKTRELTLEQRISHIEFLLKLFGSLSGVSLVLLLGFAFWLGTLSTKVSTSSDTIDKVYRSVSGDRDSLQSRTSVIESKLTSIDNKLTSMDANLTELVKFRARTWSTVKPVPRPTPEP